MLALIGDGAGPEQEEQHFTRAGAGAKGSTGDGEEGDILSLHAYIGRCYLRRSLDWPLAAYCSTDDIQDGHSRERESWASYAMISL